MALGKRKQEQQEAWISTTDLPRSPGHPFYRRLNQLLAEAKFDAWVEECCRPHYVADIGRPSIPPGVYFRMIFVGYFEGKASQRGIAWRCSDSRSLAAFLGYAPTEATPDHSTLTRVHQRLPLEVHEEVFQFLLRIAADQKLLKGTTVAVDATTLEADAALKKLKRLDSGEDYREYVKRLMAEAGSQTPTTEEVIRFDRKRKGKTLSNDEWKSSTDADSRIAKMKDGTTHLAYKAEHVIDVDSDLVLAATVHGGDAADTATLGDSVMQAQINVDAAHGIDRNDAANAAVASPVAIRNVVADKGYHSAATMTWAADVGVRTYIAEPEGRKYKEASPAEKQAIQGNRRRQHGTRGKKLRRKRSEVVERSFAHVCETGDGRRCRLRGLIKVTKRYLLQVAARNLGVMMRKLFGVGTARSLQGSAALACLVYFAIRSWRTLRGTLARIADLRQRIVNVISGPLRLAA